MKIRTDFVTNSSSSSFITMRVKSRRMQNLLELETASELNEMIDEAIDVAYEEFENSEIPFVFDYASVSGYLLFMLENAGEIFEDEFDEDELNDGDLQSVEIDHAEFDDGSYGPFEYVRINKKKKLTIFVEETYDEDAYKGEDISGMEFYFVGGMDEFGDKEAIIDFINTHGGSITETITEKTRYAICGDIKKNTAELKTIREACIPILSEDAFRYRYMDETPYDDIYGMAYEVGFEDVTVLEWFEKYGLGEVTIEFWRDNQWTAKNDPPHDSVFLDEIKDKIFVLTGFDDATEAKYVKIIEDSGGIVKSSTVLKTNYLVYNPAYDHETVKLKRAKEHIAQGKDIVILTEDEFIKKLESDNKSTSKVYVGHPVFGRGVVTDVDDNIITVCFDDVGVKVLAKNIAPLKQLSEGEEYFVNYDAAQSDKGFGSDHTSGNSAEQHAINRKEFVFPEIKKTDIAGRRFCTLLMNEEVDQQLKEYLESKHAELSEDITNPGVSLICGKNEATILRKANAFGLVKPIEAAIYEIGDFISENRGLGTVEFGSYPTEKDGNDQPIKWNVIYQDNDRILLLSAYGIDARKYASRKKDSTWESSELRQWLNSEFYDRAFSEEEKVFIEKTVLDNDLNSETENLIGNQTTDHVFLLSTVEAERYLSKSERWIQPTPYALSRGAYIDDKTGNSWWWLRNPGHTLTQAACVYSGGGVYSYGYDVDYAHCTICPAIWLKLPQPNRFVTELPRKNICDNRESLSV